MKPSKGIAATLIAALPAPVLAQTLAGGADEPLPYVRIGLAFIACCALAAVAAVLMQARLRRGGKPVSLAAVFGRLSGWIPAAGAERPLRVIDSVRVSPQLEVCVLGWQGEEYLIAASAQSAVLLDKRPPAGEGGR